MAYYSQTQAHNYTQHFLSGASALMAKVAARYEHYRIYHTSVAELRKLSDRDLRDLGLHRSMIKSVAHEAADKKSRM